MDFVMIAKWFVMGGYILRVLMIPRLIQQDVEGNEPVSLGVAVWVRLISGGVSVFVIWVLLTSL